MRYDKKMTDKRVWPLVSLRRRRDNLRDKLENLMRARLKLKQQELDNLRVTSDVAAELVEIKRELKKRGYDN